MHCKKVVPFLDLSVDGDEKKKVMIAIEKVLDHGIFIQGPEHDLFEEKIARKLNRKHAIAVGSGTDALYLTFKCLNLSLGDEVITTPLSWIASVNSFALLGAVPVFADILEDMTISPESIVSRITSKTKAILTVDYAGLPCEYDEIQNIADEYGLALIEDGSQAFGAKYKEKPVGSFGLASCISLNPMKSLAACGEAGVILTDDDDLAESIKVARYNGMVDKSTCYKPGVNGRMDTLQAAILNERLDFFEDKINKRRENARYYSAMLEGAYKTPVFPKYKEHVFFLYLIEDKCRNDLFEYLNNNGIEARVRDNILICDQPAYSRLPGHNVPYARSKVDNKLAIPVSEKLTADQRETVCDFLLNWRNNG